LFALPLGAQTPPTNRAAFARPAVTLAPPPAARPAPPQTNDPLGSLMTSVASIDIDSPVTVQAEFDPPVVAMGARAIYRLTILAMNESVTLPDPLPVPAGLELAPGGRGQSYQAMGIKLQPRTTLNYRVTARAPGAYTFPSFNLTAYGKPAPVPAARLQVVPLGTPGLREAPRLWVELPEGPYYVGQSLRIRVIMPEPADGQVLGLLQARVAGDSILTEPVIFGQRREAVQRDGRAYPAFIQEVAITPIMPGKQALVAQGQAVFNRPMAAVPGQPIVAFQSQQQLVDSDPVTLEVKSLPTEGQLPGFTGGIGSFKLDPPKLSTNQVRAGEVIALTLTIRGDGNVGRLAPPPPPFLREWQTFPPTGDPAPPYVIQQRGFNTFTYTLIPLTERLKATPSIPFSGFDPKLGAYVDLTVPPVPLTVLPSPGGASNRLAAARDAPRNPDLDEVSGREPELALTGLAETPGPVAGSLVPWQERPSFALLQLLPAIALLALVGWDQRRRLLEKHPELVRKRQARRQLRRCRRLTRKAAAAQDPAGFLAGAVNGFRAVCAPQAAANPDALVCGDVLRELPVSERKGKGGEVVRRLFSAADARRFGKVQGDGADLLALQPEVERLFDQMKARL
jgi:hypothetical protein